MPPTTTGTSSTPAARSPSTTAGHDLQVRARQDRQPDDVHALLHRGGDDLRGREPDALVDHLEADVAGAHGHLLGAVGVPVEARACRRACAAAGASSSPVARTRARTAAISARRPRRRPPPRRPVGARNSPNTSRSAPAHSPVVTPALAQAIEASMRFASVLAASRSSSSAASTAAASRPARHARIASTAAASVGRVDGLDRRRALGLQRAGLGGLEPVDADDDVLARLDPPPPLRQRRAPARPSCSRTRRPRPPRPSPGPGRSPCGRPATSSATLASTTRLPSKRSSYSSRSVS